MLNWAMSPHVKRLNMAFVLVDEKLADVSDRLTGNPHVATLEVPLPSEDDRATFIEAIDRRRAGHRLQGFSDFDAKELATLTAGISLADLNVLVESARESGKRLDADGVPLAQEAAARAAVPRAARVHRAEVDARHGRRTRGGEGAAARGREALEAGRTRQPADGLSALRAGRHRQVVPRPVPERRDRHPVRDPEELQIEVRRRDRRQSRACAVGAPRDGPGGRRRRRGGRRARQPRGGRRFRHVEPRVRDDRRPDGRHAVSGPDHLDAAHGPSRSAADRPQTSGAGRGPHPALLSDR